MNTVQPYNGRITDENRAYWSSEKRSKGARGLFKLAAARSLHSHDQKE